MQSVRACIHCVLLALLVRLLLRTTVSIAPLSKQAWSCAMPSRESSGCREVRACSNIGTGHFPSPADSMNFKVLGSGMRHVVQPRRHREHHTSDPRHTLRISRLLRNASSDISLSSSSAWLCTAPSGTITKCLACIFLAREQLIITSIYDDKG